MTSTLKEGDLAPDFVLTADTFDDISLHAQKGKNIVIYFYPKDNTPGCTIEAVDFSEKIKEFEDHDTLVFGVSRDDAQSHEHFKNMKKLKVTLLSDENLEMMPEYGVWVEKNMYGKKYMGVERTTFLLDKSKKIKKIWNKVKVNGHANEVLEEVKKLK